MARALSEAGHEVFWLAPGMKSTGDMKFLPLSKKCIPHFGPLGWTLRLWMSFHKHKKDLQEVDAVFTVREYDAFGFLSHLKYRSIPHVFFSRGDTVSVYRINYPALNSFIDKVTSLATIWFYPIIQRFVLRHADLVVVQADFLKQILRNRHSYINSSIRVLTNDCPKLSNCKKEGNNVIGPLPAMGKRDHTLRLGILAPLWWECKGIGVFVDALEILKDKLDFKAVIGGAGPDSERLGSYITKMGLNDVVVRLGWIDNVKQFFNQIDLIVIPSKYDSCPNVVLEVVSSGVPVLASDIPAHKELLSFKELLFESCNSQNLANKIIALAANPDKLALNRKLMSARKTALSFNWDNEIVKILESTATNNRKMLNS
ncbi:MAG: glycosyltransferase family 4 protein [Desulfobacter sp.]|nr:MAG: glycosyltransferase family 4 protein [Desulfobacter sp.]